MNLSTPIKISPDKSLDHNSKILILGSCFAENVGNRLIDHRFNVCLNPTGILYNPASIAQVIERLISKDDFSEEDIFFHQGLWNSFYHHGCFSNSDKDAALYMMNTKFLNGCSQLTNASHLIITFGSSYVYEHDGNVVSNCHKLPSKEFNERFLTVDEIVNKYKVLIQSIRNINPNIKIIFTISPVRYMGNGAHHSQINKSILLLATSKICDECNTSYFPSYEIMMDELRDYRFYASDMIHPSPVAVEYIYERFIETYFTNEAVSLISDIEKINKSLSHRPLHPDSDTYLLFQKKLSQQIAAIAHKYPNIKF